MTNPVCDKCKSSRYVSSEDLKNRIDDSKYAYVYFCQECQMALDIVRYKKQRMRFADLKVEGLTNLETLADCTILKPSKPDEWTPMVMLQRYANNEELGAHFYTVRPETQKGLLLLKNSHPIGYIIWTDNPMERPTIRQIFIVIDERRKHYATLLTKHFVENVINGRDFCVETPNPNFCTILVQLGYAEFSSEGGISGLKCNFVSCG